MRAPINTIPIDARPILVAALMSAANIGTAQPVVEALNQDSNADACITEGHPVKRDMETRSRQVSKWIERITDMSRLHTREQVAHAFKKPNTLVAWTRVTDYESRIESLYLSEAEYKAVAKMMEGVSDSTLCRFFHVKDKDGLRSAFMTHSGLTADEVDDHWSKCRVILGSAIIAKHNKSYANWLRFASDKNHPFFNNVKDSDSVPRGVAWTTLPGVDGEIPFNKAHTNMLPTCMDQWFYTKNRELHPVEKRTMRTEIDLREHRSRLAIIFDLLKRWSLQATRPADQDKEYFFPLESEVPFKGVKIDTNSAIKAEWDMSLETAQKLNNVMKNPEAIRPVYTRDFAVYFLSQAPRFQPTMYSNDEADNELLNRVMNRV
eukprot:Blabericola_migrator_1__3476@NODE_2029_length_3388_cov_20_334237_g1289_i0_p2_GENE_NODE_2029_length_3388_cov_20_334237_g1289_i0NODE_2029_length_3388_cov_20_334237_g1289_i0_p2_ORF_typecomplete_len377_score79_48_NODE_2029_length_3388_cov_20_334237_g1289_i04041534